MDVFVGLMLGNYVEELLFLAVEGGREPVGHGAADAVFGMATGNTVFEEDAMPLELEADGSDVAVGGFEAILDSVAESAFGLASLGARLVGAVAAFAMVEGGGGLFGETLGGSGPAFDLVVVLGLVEEGTAAGVDVFDSEGAGHGN